MARPRPIGTWLPGRVGCKRGPPNAPPLKKKKKQRTDQQEKKIERIPDLQELNVEVTAENFVSMSAKGNWSISRQCGNNEHDFLPKGGALCLQNSRSTELHLSARGASHLPDMHPVHDNSECMNAQEVNEDKEFSPMARPKVRIGTWLPGRVGCKRGAPNAPPLKKKKKKQQRTDQQEKKIERIPDLKELNVEVTAENFVSMSAKGNWCISWPCGKNDHNFLPIGGDLYLQNSRSAELHLPARGASQLPDMLLPLHDSPGCGYSAIGGNLHLSDPHLKCMTAKEFNEDKEEPNKGATEDNVVSVTNKGNWSISWQRGTSENFAPKEEGLFLQNSHSTELHLSTRGASTLPDMHPQHDTPESNYTALGGKFHLPDSCPKRRTAEELNEDKEEMKIEMLPDLQEPHKGAGADNAVLMSNEENWSMSEQCGTSENFSPKGDNLYLQNSHSTNFRLSARCGSYLPNMDPQDDTPESNYSAVGGNLKYATAEQLNEDEEASDANSLVNRWACRVCKVAAVSIAVRPCCHLCLCWECESSTDECPVCGQAKSDVFYINS